MLILVTISLALLSLTLKCAPLERPETLSEHDPFVMIDKEGREFLMSRTPSPEKQAHSPPPSVPFEPDYSLLLHSVARHNEFYKPKPDQNCENHSGSDLTPNSALKLYISSLMSGDLEKSRFLEETLEQSTILFSSTDSHVELPIEQVDEIKEEAIESENEFVKSEQPTNASSDSEINFEQLEKSLTGYVPPEEKEFYKTSTAGEVPAEKPASIQPELAQVNEPTWSFPSGTSSTSMAIGILAIFAAYATLRNK